MGDFIGAFIGVLSRAGKSTDMLLLTSVSSTSASCGSAVALVSFRSLSAACVLKQTNFYLLVIICCMLKIRVFKKVRSSNKFFPVSTFGIGFGYTCCELLVRNIRQEYKRILLDYKVRCSSKLPCKHFL